MSFRDPQRDEPQRGAPSRRDTVVQQLQPGDPPPDAQCQYGGGYGDYDEAAPLAAPAAGAVAPRPGARGYRGVGPKGYVRSDGRVLEDACEALANEEHIDASEIQVSVQDGEVTLHGWVRDRGTKRAAEDTVASCRGVRHVHNQLRLSAQAESGSS